MASSVMTSTTWGCGGLQSASGRGLGKRRVGSTARRVVSYAKGGGQYDYDVLILGAGVGGHGAALHAAECGLKTAILERAEMGGTCVNRGCIPSKALLSAAGRVREMRDAHHLKALGIQVDPSAVSFDRDGISEHAGQLVAKLRKNLTNSMTGLGVDVLQGIGTFVDEHTVSYAKPGLLDKTVTAKHIIIATGSVPFVPPGVNVDGKTVLTSDHATTLPDLPKWVAIIGSGYIGLEFADVYTALGCEVTFIEALDNIMPGFDPEIAKLAERVLVTPRAIDYKTGVLAMKVTPGNPDEEVGVKIALHDRETRAFVEEMEVDCVLVATGRAPFTDGLGLANIGAATDRRGFIPCDDLCRVQLSNGKVSDNVYCIGDANGKMMLAHTASAHGISVIEHIMGRDKPVNHLAIPAACFTHPEIAFVGHTEPQARDAAEKGGYGDKVAVAKCSFKANSKALADGDAEGLCKVIFRTDNGEILGCHIIGPHASDMIHEASTAVHNGTPVQELKFAVHTHPTLAEVVDECFKHAGAQVQDSKKVGSNAVPGPQAKAKAAPASTGAAAPAPTKPKAAAAGAK